MQRQPVKSSQIRSVGYDSAAQVLEIEFHSGGVYRYFGVPSEVHTALLRARSRGRYFEAHIKGAYLCEMQDE
jgi:hypothetical protein